MNESKLYFRSANFFPRIIQRFRVRHGLSCVNGPFWPVRAGCYSQAAFSLPHSKPLYYYKFTNSQSLNHPSSSCVLLSANVRPDTAAYLSTLFDVGGIAGGIAAGLVSDATGKSASTCAVMLVAAIPSVRNSLELLLNRTVWITSDAI